MISHDIRVAELRGWSRLPVYTLKELAAREVTAAELREGVLLVKPGGELAQLLRPERLRVRLDGRDESWRAMAFCGQQGWVDVILLAGPDPLPEERPDGALPFALNDAGTGPALHRRSGKVTLEYEFVGAR